MENNNEVMETENFYYEDIVDGVNMLLTKETLTIFSEAGILKKEIIDKVEENLPPIYDKETLDAYCKRFLQFVLIDQLNNNFAENIDQKAKINKVSSDAGEKPHIEPEVLKKYLYAYESGDYAGIYNVISKSTAILTTIGKNKVKPHYMDGTQLKVYQKYINDYRRNLLNEFSKISIPQPVYEDISVDEEEFEIEDNINVDADYEETIEEITEDNTENATENVLEDEIEEDTLPEFDEEDNLSDIEEDALPGFEDEEPEEDTLPGFEDEEDSLSELEEKTLPDFDDEEPEEDTLPGFEDEEEKLSDLEETSEENELENELDDELNTELDDELDDDTLPGIEEDEPAEEIEEIEEDEKYELEPNEEYSVETEEESLFDDEINDEIDTDSILSSIDELDDIQVPKNETIKDKPVEEDLEEDILPGFEDEEENVSELEETSEENELGNGLDDELNTELDAELDDDILPGFEDEEPIEDVSEVEELEEENLEEDILPGFEEEESLSELEETSEENELENELDDELNTELDAELDDDTLPGFEEDESAEEVSEVEELEEDALPGFEDEEENVSELEEETSEENELENELDDELNTKLDDELEDDTLLSFEEDEPAEELEEDALPGFEEENLEEDTLPGFEDEESAEEVSEVEELEEENLEEPEILDERRNYDLVFEDNYYEIADISEEYLNAHPDYKNSKFVEATGGTNLDDFISTMLYLKDAEKTEIVGIFNNIPLHTRNLQTVDEIENVYDKLVEEIDEDDGKLKSKAECISYDEYYNQYIQRDVSRKAVSYQQEHKDIKMILIPQNNATLEEFIEAALYFIQDDMTGNALNYGSKTIIASDYSSKDEIYNALLEKSDDEKTKVKSTNEDITNEDTTNEDATNEETKNEIGEDIIESQEIEGEVFDKSPEYYKSIAKISKNKTDAYREKHPECKKVMIVVERDIQTAQDFFEAVRYYNSVNKNIIAQYDGIQLIARKYNSAEEMIEAYKIKKLKKNGKE